MASLAPNFSISPQRLAAFRARARDSRPRPSGDPTRRARGEPFDAIVSAAAYTAVDKAESDAATARAVNTDSPGVLAAIAHQRGVPFVHVSTDFVFDGQQGPALCSDAPTAPLGVYGLTKRDGEIAVQAAHPQALIVRTAWVHSAHGSNFVKTCCG